MNCKHYCFLFFFILQLISQSTYCQKYDYNWLGGHRATGMNTGVIMEFDPSSISYDTFELKMYVEQSNFAISDQEGNLQFYTNGNVVASWDHSIMEGGKGFNEGSFYDDFDYWLGDTINNYPYYLYQFMVIPDGIDEHVFYLIHAYMRSEWDANMAYNDKMQISKIDMSVNGGKGKVIYKNKYFVEEVFSRAFTLIEHGNGRDWWVVMRKHSGLEYRSILLSRDSVVEVVNSIISGLSNSGFSFDDSLYSSISLLAVSPAGNKLIDNYGWNNIKLMDFDRCSGVVSLVDTFQIGDTRAVKYEIGGDSTVYIRPYDFFSFSPTGRFLYGVGYGDFSQWDLEATDVTNSRVKLSGPSIFLDIDQTPTTGFGGWKSFSLGPDGKIYNLFRHNHNVINYPDEKGLACDFCLASDNLPSCLDVPYYLYSGYYPNYRLGALTGSGCDTISTSISTPGVSRFELTVYPNPASGPVQVEITLPDYGRQDTELVIHDAMGREVHRHRYPPYAYLHTWDTSNVPNGTYIIQLVSDQQTVATSRVVVME